MLSEKSLILALAQTQGKRHIKRIAFFTFCYREAATIIVTLSEQRGYIV